VTQKSSPRVLPGMESGLR